MKKLLYIFILLYSYSNLLSQNTYDKIYHVAFSGLRLISYDTNNYTLYSTSKDAATHYLNRNIFITDLNGNALDTHKLYITNAEFKLKMQLYD